ncbi:MAG: ABC transporter ATP-binding protein SaoA [Chitinophagales bacterium]
MSWVEVEGITKAFGNSKSSHVVLDGLTFNIQQNQFVSLLGQSGCGKTTLLSIIAGFQKAESGQVRVGGRAIYNPAPDRAFVFQNYMLFPWMTVRENILYPMKRQRMSPGEREALLERLLALARLQGKERLFPHELSGGMKQRTALVRALACRPKVLLMDEPLGAIDFQMRHSLQEEMEGIFMEDPLTIIMVTHDVDEAVYMSDRVLVMGNQRGRVVEDLAINLSRPRDRRDHRYQEYVYHLISLLKKQSPVGYELLKQTGEVVKGKGSIEITG